MAKTMVSGVDFPKKTNPLIGKSHYYNGMKYMIYYYVPIIIMIYRLRVLLRSP